MKLPLLWILVPTLYNLIDGKDVTLSLTYFDTKIYPNAVCNDGSTGGFYFAKSPSNSPYWLVHLQGGGWCWNRTSCAERNITSPHLTTNKYWKDTVLKTGIFDDNSTLNPLYDANKIYVPYCTSDAYMGYRLPSVATDEWIFMGQQIVYAVINTLISSPKYGLGQIPNRDILVFSGCSAGGRGAMVNLDYLPTEIIPDNIQLKSIFGILDSGLYINIQPYTPSYTSLGKQTESVYSYMNCTQRVSNSKCGDYYTSNDDKWKCLFGQYKMPLLNVSHIINAAQYDSYQLSVNEGSQNVATYTNAQKEYAENPFRSTMRDVVLSTNISSNILSTSCYHHCVTEEMEFWNITTDGVSLSDVIRNYMNNMENDGDNFVNKYVGNCTNGIDCGQGCNPVNVPW